MGNLLQVSAEALQTVITHRVTVSNSHTHTHAHAHAHTHTLAHTHSHTHTHTHTHTHHTHTHTHNTHPQHTHTLAHTHTHTHTHVHTQKFISLHALRCKQIFWVQSNLNSIVYKIDNKKCIFSTKLMNYFFKYIKGENSYFKLFKKIERCFCKFVSFTFMQKIYYQTRILL